MTTAAERLKQARIAAGHPSAESFAKIFGYANATYRAHERGDRNYKADTAKAYARDLGVTWQWLMFGEELDVQTGDQFSGDMPSQRSQRGPDRGVAVAEIDVRAQGGSGGNHDAFEAEPTVAEWRMPGDVIRAQTSANIGSLRILTVYGDSMVPDFLPGERALVDTSDRNPSPAGIFVVWDGVGLVVKQLEVVPYSDPPKVKLKSRNPNYDAYELPLGDVVINARVIGKWQWT